ncbi:MAG: decaprenyl-phosphate phosphoribosyltransferase [Candidatus Hydrogenedentes bacterium]|nr:decaprenyl-phosphate phosphoribosyltransferase [Candidatus Hydrogenedentota bacterium]
MGELGRKLILIVRTLRVYQWTKNLLVLAALIFSQEFLDLDKVLINLAALLTFCLASSATYIINDIVDIEKDRAHPKKRRRPIASGAVDVPVAAVLAAVLLAGAGLVGWLVRPPFLAAMLTYVALTLSYSFWLKNVLLIDVLLLAMGFVVRAIAGAIAIEVTFSNWLVVCTLFLALFLGLSKRRHELALLEDNAAEHREVLHQYSIQFLDQLILMMAGAALITYTIYTCSPEVIERLHTQNLYLTLPFVVYGLARYLYLVHHKTGGGDPSSTLLSDWPLGVTVLGWGIACVLIIYV